MVDYNLTHGERIANLGKIGETIVSNWLNRTGHSVELSLDKYDYQKDMIVDGNRVVEVKTEQPYVRFNCVSFRSDQLRKCTSVDDLYVVTSVALVNENYKHNGKIFRIDPKNFTSFKYRTKFGIDMIGIPFNQPSVKEVYVLTDKEKNELMKYSKSEYGRV